jgi:hypothetical protein
MTVLFAEQKMLFHVSVCPDCAQYIKEGRTPKFEDGWAAVYWTYLTKTKNETIAKKFVNCIPIELFLSWANSYSLFSPCIQLECGERNVEGESFIFKDVTYFYQKLRKMQQNPKKHLKSGKWEDFVDQTATMLVSCPSGCVRHFDDNKLRHMSMKFYFRHIDPRFRSFGAVKGPLYGVRPDWVNRRSRIGMEFRPGFVFIPGNGPQFLLCKREVHRMENTRFIHVPNNPVLTKPVNAPSAIAPLMATAHVTRSGKRGRHNVTFPVTEMSGNSGGASTIQLCQKLNQMPPQTVEVERVAAIAIKERPDLFNHFASQKGIEEAEHYKRIAERRLENEHAKKSFEHCRSSGTYMDRGDTVHELKALLKTIQLDKDSEEQPKNSDQSSEESKMKREVDRLRDCLTFIRIPINSLGKRNQRSHEPLVFPIWWRIKANDTSAAGTTLLLSVLGNVRPMHRNMNESTWSRNPETDEKIALEAVQSLLHKEMFGRVNGFGQKIIKKVDTIDKDLWKERASPAPTDTPPSSMQISVPDNQEEEDDDRAFVDPAADHGINEQSSSDDEDECPEASDHESSSGEEGNGPQKPKSSRNELNKNKMEKIPDQVAKWLSFYTKRMKRINSDNFHLDDGENGAERIDTLLYAAREATDKVRTPPLFIRKKKFTLVFAANIRRNELQRDKLDLQILTRWSEKERWSYLANGKERVIDNLNIWDTNNGQNLSGTYNFLIYEKVDKHHTDEEFVEFNLIGGQTKVKCNAHEESGYLAHRPFDNKNKIKCCHDGLRCKNQGSWRCCFQTCGFHCRGALCDKHMKERQQQNVKSFVKPIYQPFFSFSEDSRNNFNKMEDIQDEVEEAVTEQLFDVYEFGDENELSAEAHAEAREAEYAADLMTLGTTELNASGINRGFQNIFNFLIVDNFSQKSKSFCFINRRKPA